MTPLQAVATIVSTLLIVFGFVITFLGIRQLEGPAYPVGSGLLLIAYGLWISGRDVPRSKPLSGEAS